MTLDEGEHIILKGANAMLPRARAPVVLTNKRLIVQKVKGLVKKTYSIDFDISFNEIAEAYTDVDGISGLSVMKLKLKNGKEFKISLNSNAATALFGSLNTIRLTQKGISDRWVNAINIAKEAIKSQSETKEPLKVLQIRYAKGEITREKYEEMRKVLERES